MCVLLCGFPFCFGFVTKTELMPRRWAVQLYFIPISVSYTLCVFVCVFAGEVSSYHGLKVGLNPRPVSLGDLRHDHLPLSGYPFPHLEQEAGCSFRAIIN